MKKRKTYDELTIADDFMFCKVMENNEELCKEMIERILGTKIEIVKKPERQKSIELSPDGKGIRLDIRLESNSKIYELEMQNGHREELPKRGRYYLALTALDLMEKGAKYRELKDNVLIFICTFDPFGAGRAKYTVKQVIEENPDVEYNDGTSIVYLSTLENSNGQDAIDEELKGALDYIDGRDPASDFAKRIEIAVVKAKQQKEWRKDYMLLEEVIEEGREEGRLEATFGLIQNLMNNQHISAEEAMEALGIPQDEQPKYLERLK